MRSCLQSASACIPRPTGKGRVQRTEKNNTITMLADRVNVRSQRRADGKQQMKNKNKQDQMQCQPVQWRRRELKSLASKSKCGALAWLSMGSLLL